MIDLDLSNNFNKFNLPIFFLEDKQKEAIVTGNAINYF